ncbi:M23 family metallopeptidase [Frankia sp. Cppng1_Ct_nod]|uniref:murein hydrolase activator EnvC family protein n=1 Tax=Frankia sp. Cppng1_Ct_nod TaxID=2897162 RepID=UPI0010414DDF|nr:M23 family metallopeptidase [Frankia sp. Cppng1_Ct_nod]
MIPPPRHRSLALLVATVLIVLVATRWPHPVAGYGTRAASSLASLPAAGSRDANSAPSTSPAPPTDPVTSARRTPISLVAAWRAPLDPPLIVDRGFAPPLTPYGPGHRGVDLEGVPGAAVRAAGSGTVSFAGLIAGRGVITVVHGPLRTTYEPVDPVVAAGQSVISGQVIGHLVAAHPGCRANACLHWGLLEGSRYLDPLSLLHGPPRLLPIG